MAEVGISHFFGPFVQPYRKLVSEVILPFEHFLEHRGGAEAAQRGPPKGAALGKIWRFHDLKTRFLQ